MVSKEAWQAVGIAGLVALILMPFWFLIAWLVPLANPTGAVAQTGIGGFLGMAAAASAGLVLFCIPLFAVIERLMR